MKIYFSFSDRAPNFDSHDWSMLGLQNPYFANSMQSWNMRYVIAQNIIYPGKRTS